LSFSFSFFLHTLLPPTSTLFPYTTLFRSHLQVRMEIDARAIPFVDRLFVGRSKSRQRIGIIRESAESPARLDVVPAQKPQSVLRSEEHTSELQSPCNLVCRLLLEKKKKKN